MKKFYTLLLAILFIPQLAHATDPATQFIQDISNQVIDTIGKDLPQNEKLALFKKEFTSALDLKNIGQFVLGVYWRKATPAQKEAFLDVFMDFTTKVWADRFTLYRGQKWIFKGTRPAERNQIYVDTAFQNTPPVEVIWRVKPKDNSYRIIDIIIENVSMAMTYRNEYTTFLQAHNGDIQALIDELKRKNENFQWTKK